MKKNIVTLIVAAFIGVMPLSAQAFSTEPRTHAIDIGLRAGFALDKTLWSPSPGFEIVIPIVTKHFAIEIGGLFHGYYPPSRTEEREFATKSFEQMYYAINALSLGARYYMHFGRFEPYASLSAHYLHIVQRELLFIKSYLNNEEYVEKVLITIQPDERIHTVGGSIGLGCAFRVFKHFYIGLETKLFLSTLTPAWINHATIGLRF